MRRVTAEDEHQWLLDREEHRLAIDEHMLCGIDKIASRWREDTAILELGPGPMDDLRAHAARLGIPIIQADTRPAHEGVAALEPLWTREQRLPWTNGDFTGILAREVFEHVYHLREMLAECHRVLTPGGSLWFTTPYLYPLHDYEPELGGDWFRASPRCWERMLADAGFVHVEVNAGRCLWDNWQTPVSILGMARK